MTKKDVKTLVLFIIYVAVMIIQYIVIFNVKYIVDINPLTRKVITDDEAYLYIYSPLDHLFFYILILFAIMLLYTIVKKECIKAMSVCSKIVSIFMVVIIILGFFAPNEFGICIVTNIAMLLCLRAIKLHTRKNYPQVKLSDKLMKHNYYKVILTLLIIIGVNVIYIVIPKNTLYLYRDVQQGYTQQYMIDDGFLEEIGTFILRDDVNIGIGSPSCEGWIFKAMKEGEKQLVISDNPPGYGDREYCEITITVDKNLKFHNILSFDYINRIYPLNVLIIMCSILCMAFFISPSSY